MEEATIDVDDVGDVYVMPARSDDPAIVSTAQDRAGVVRIRGDGKIEGLVDGGRWIGGFSVAPEGDEMTLHGCAAVGLHHQSTEGWAMDRAVSDQAQRAGGLDGDAVAMGRGVVLMVDQGMLLRVSAGEVVTVGSAELTFGGDTVSTRCGPLPQRPRAMTRCGADVCAACRPRRAEAPGRPRLTAASRDRGRAGPTRAARPGDSGARGSKRGRWGCRRRRR